MKEELPSLINSSLATFCAFSMDVLTWLWCAHRHSLRELQSAERKKIGPFLRGELSCSDLPDYFRGKLFCSDDCNAKITSEGRNHVPWFPSLYGFIPLAIVSSSTFSLANAVSRELIRDHFREMQDTDAVDAEGDEKGGFEEAFFVQLSEKCDGGFTFSNAARHSCIISVRSHVEAIIRSARIEALGTSSPCQSSSFPERKRTKLESSFSKDVGGSSLPTGKSNAVGTSSRFPVIHRLLIVVSCASDACQSFSWSTVAANRGRGASSTGSAAASSANPRLAHRRQPRQNADILQLFIGDVVGLQQFARAQLNTLYRAMPSVLSPLHQVFLSIMLVPEDEVCEHAQLAQRLTLMFGRELIIRCFSHTQQPLKKLSTDSLNDRAHRDDRYTIEEALHLLALWDPGAVYHHPKPSKLPSQSSPTEIQASETAISRLLLSDSRFFFLRPDHLPLAWFLWNSLRIFPVLLAPTCLISLQRLWASRRRMDDVLYAFHTMLMPFALSSTDNGAISSSFREGSQTHSLGTQRYGDDEGGTGGLNASTRKQTVKLLNALFLSARELSVQCTHRLKDTECSLEPGDSSVHHGRGVASAHVEAVCFVLLYEDLISYRSARILRFPALLTALSHVYDDVVRCQRSVNSGMKLSPHEKAQKLLSSLQLPLFSPAAPFSLSPHNASNWCGATPPSVRSEMHRVALLAVLPSQASLEQLYDSHGSVLSSASALSIDEAQHVSSNNFFGPLVPREARVLHYMTAYGSHVASAGEISAESSSRAHLRFLSSSVPLAHLQWAAQLSDAAIIRTLEVLRRSGLVTVNTTDITGRATLGASAPLDG